MGSKTLFTIGLACALAPRVSGQEGDRERVAVTPRPRVPKSAGPRPSIRVDSRLVLVPVTVTDPLGAPFAGLTRADFNLFEDGVEQQLRYCSAEDAPVSLGVVFDASRSMVGKLDQSRAAVARFFQTAMPADEFFLVEFSDAPRLLCDFTTDTVGLEKTLVGIVPRNWTALLDAVYMAMHKMKRARNSRRALLVLSDGGDNNSRYTEAEMKALVREGDVCIYSIALVGGGLLRRHVRLLRNLSEETGGLLCEVEKLEELPDAVEKISAAMRRQYLLGYASSNAANNGLYRRIRLKLNPPAGLPPLRASWRTGYYAPVGP